MLQLEHISKAYTTASFTQLALDDVSVAFRDNEFAAILGPSGSGKTTLLNILGGLDHADSGDIVIGGVSTTDYDDRAWDTYRNHRIGFIFQSYNLIPHQSVLSNVELALTLAGIPAKERHERAREALAQVGLADHVDKRPSQLSGGQKQRVAIARALINDPDIVLADEPTGALDTETGVQVMDLLAQIARDRLVIMVTHNPELAKRYATRIIRLQDGRIADDSRPLGDDELLGVGVLPAGRDTSDTARHASMSFLTALALSFNNLMTKKGRTFMTAFAGSIGIIGIAAILALSNGVNDYIARTEEEALSSYPLTITKSSFDVASMMAARTGIGDGEADDSDAAETDTAGTITQRAIMSDMFAQVKNNDLTSFKAFLESGASGVESYVNSIQYSYGITPQVYQADTSEDIVRLNPSRMSQTFSNGLSGSALLGGASTVSSFTELPDDRKLLEQSFELAEGRWPAAFDECVLICRQDGSISDFTLYSLGVYDTKVMDDMTTKLLAGEEVEIPDTERAFTVDDALNLRFSVVPASSLYRRNAEQGTWSDMTGDREFMRQVLAKGVDLHVVGVVWSQDATSSLGASEGIGYTPALTRHLMDEAAASEIVKAQLANRDVDVFTGKTFEELADEEGQKFDVESMFSVDEDALRSAFSFDASALEGLGSGIDLSGVDFSSAASGIDPSALSNLDLDTSALSSIFDEQTMVQIMQGAPEFDPSLLDLSPADVELTEEQLARIGQAATDLQTGFSAWMALPENAETVGAALSADPPDYVSLMQAYLQTDEARQIVEPLGQELSEELTGEVSERMTQALSTYMTEQFAPYIAEAMGSLMQEAATALGKQMAKQLAERLASQMAAVTGKVGEQLGSVLSEQMTAQMSQLSASLESGFTVDAAAFASAIEVNMTQEDLTSLLTNYMNADELTYEGNLSKLGYATVESPEAISIYPVDFPAKEAVLEIVDDYNARAEREGRQDETIEYTDLVGALMSSVTSIVNTISLVLIAFVSISLVVSSIMIGVITYISVLERKKEIGILRAMGASKLNVANIFNAETVIEGLFAGVLAVAVVYVVSAPVNELVYRLQDVPDIMQLSPQNALVLVGISVILTLVAGLIPSSSAARRDPVEALRSE